MGKVSNFTIFSLTIIMLIGVIIFSSAIKINEIHENKLLYAMQSKVEYFAERCYLENNCAGEITLGTLYERNYLTEIINPVTKEILDYNTKINYLDGKINIIWQ